MIIQQARGRSYRRTRRPLPSCRAWMSGRRCSDNHRAWERAMNGTTRERSWRRAVLATSILLASVGSACGSSSLPSQPDFGYIHVTVTSSGGDLDTDGYTVVVDAEQPRKLD